MTYYYTSVYDVLISFRKYESKTQAHVYMEVSTVSEQDIQITAATDGLEEILKDLGIG